jgi:two-component system chemotaxis response regulator CheY
MSKKIIVVDDSDTVRRQVCAALESAGYRTVEASDGLQGLRVAEENADACVIISDLNMPNLGGIDMIAKLKNGGKNANLAALMLTTEGDPDLVKRAKIAGARAWIVKPFRADLLVATVRKLAGDA